MRHVAIIIWDQISPKTYKLKKKTSHSNSRTFSQPFIGIELSSLPTVTTYLWGKRKKKKKPKLGEQEEDGNLGI